MKSNLVICVLEGKIELLLSIERKFRPMIFNFYQKNNVNIYFSRLKDRFEKLEGRGFSVQRPRKRSYVSGNFVPCQYLHNVILNVALGQEYAFTRWISSRGWIVVSIYNSPLAHIVTKNVFLRFVSGMYQWQKPTTNIFKRESST